MPDVAYARNRQGWSFKALNDKAKKAMGEDMGGPWQMAADVFWSAVSDDRFNSTVARLRSFGLEVPERVLDVAPEAKRVDPSKYLA